MRLWSTKILLPCPTENFRLCQPIHTRTIIIVYKLGHAALIYKELIMQHLPWVDDSQDERDIAAEPEDGSEQEHDAKKDHDLSTGTPDNDREKEIEDNPKDISSRPRPDFVDVVFGFDHVDDKMNTLPTDMGLGEPSMNIFLRPQFHIPNVEVHEAIESLELVEIPPRRLPLVILVDGERHSSEGEEVVEEWTPAEESLPKKKKAAKCTKPTKPNSSTSG